MRNLRQIFKGRRLIGLAGLLAFSLAVGLSGGSQAAEASPPVSLEMADISVEQEGSVALGEVVITALSAAAVSAPGSLCLQIPANFPAVWDQQVKLLSLSVDSPSGLINEAVTYPDAKTLKITLTQSWPANSKFTINNLKIDIPEFPDYEEIFSEEVVNSAPLVLSGFKAKEGASDNCASSGTILLKVPPFYAGDDGWSSGGSPSTGTVTGYKFANLSSTYSAGYYLAGRGFSAVVYAVDSDNNWISSTDTVTLSSVLSTSPATAASAQFYTDNNYATLATTATLSNGWATVYVKDAVSEKIKLKAVNGAVSGTSDEIYVEPYAYTVTATSPQTVGLGWSETVTLKDIHGNLITGTPPSAVTVTSDGNAYFYPDATYTKADQETSADYTLTSGVCTIYVKDDVAENITIQANDTYDSLNKDGGGTSNLIVVTVSLWQVKLNFSYQEAEGSTDDKITVQAWLEKDGNVINDSDLGAATLKIYDGDSLKKTLSPTTDKDPDSDGIYWFSWEDTGLEAGRGYFAQITITYAGSTHFSNDGFYLPMNKALGTLIETSTAVLQALHTTAKGISDDVVEEIAAQLTATKTDTTSALTAVQTTLPAQITAMKTELSPHINSRILNTETQVASGDTLTIRYRAPSGTAPVINVYDSDQTQLVSDTAMTAVGTTGIYEYDLTFASTWGYGFFTVICSEPTYNTLDGVTINVITANLTSIASDISSVLGSTSGLSELSNVNDILDVQFNDISTQLSQVNNQISDAVGKTVRGALGDIAGKQADVIYKAMDTVSKAMYDIGETTSGDLEALYKVSEIGAGNINYVRNKFIELENLLQINKKMIDTVTYEPIVQTWYEFR